MQNFRLKSDKERAKAVKQTFKHLKISRYTRDGEIKQKILAFVRQNAVDYSRFGLPDNLLADAEFLTLLFKADGEATVYFAPNSRDKDLLENHNFMLEYIKRRYERELLLSQKESDNDRLGWIVREYKSLMAKPEFVKMLAKEFPRAEILPIIREGIRRYESAFYTECEIEDEVAYCACVVALPFEMLREQLRIYGTSYLNYLPRDYKRFKDMLVASVESFGFRAFEPLDSSEIVKNKDLLLVAAEKEGAAALKRFLFDTLPTTKPERSCYEVGRSSCYADGHERSYLQKILLRDERIAEAVAEAEKLAEQKLKTPRNKKESEPDEDTM